MTQRSCGPVVTRGASIAPAFTLASAAVLMLAAAVMALLA